MPGLFNLQNDAVVVVLIGDRNETLMVAEEVISHAYRILRNQILESTKAASAAQAFFNECLSQLDSDELGLIPYSHLVDWIGCFEAGHFDVNKYPH